ncbi:MAG TPA: FAD-dependent oxidoreductase [Usitatibacteraceae bacterium]
MNVTVIGAGPVGATFALHARQAGLDVALLEAREGPSRESRTLALSWGSREILDEAGVWIEALQATAIHSIHTSQKGGFGRVDLSREDGGVEALGYVLNYAELQAALDAELERQGIAVIRGAVVSAIDRSGEHAGISYAFRGGEQRLATDVVVLADGGANLGKVPAIRIAEKDYGQSALLAHILADSPHRHRAFERFTGEGPAALLPKRGECDYSMVWVASPVRIESLKALDAGAFCAAFQDHFGYRAGRFLQVKNRRSYPLRLRTVSSPVAGRVVVIGNAAQALHPVAGQGFNLGLRDAIDLARGLAGHEPQSVDMRLQRYAATRSQDVSRSVGFTDFLVGAFSRDDALLRVPRGLALAAVDLLPSVRRALARRMLFGAVR